jgi:chorismate dehydratase
MNNKCIRVGMVNYLNTLPLQYGLKLLHEQGIIELQLNYPALIAQALKQGTIDIGLVPIVTKKALPSSQLIGGYGIASNGPVASVGLYSQVPINKVENILLDYQSNTSIQLVQWLMKHHWQLPVNYLPAGTNYIDEINGNTAGVIIGDRAMQHKSKFAYEYDLATYWRQHTGKPFVFAAWLSNMPLSNSFIHEFDTANGIGLQHLPEIVANTAWPYYDLYTYYTSNIQYKLTREHYDAIGLFLG